MTIIEIILSYIFIEFLLSLLILIFVLISTFCFTPFTIDTFSFLTPETVDLLQRIQKIMHINVISFALRILCLR